MLSLLRLERKQKKYSNPSRIGILLFLSYSFGIETINTFIHSVVLSKTIPDSRPKWAKCIPVFRPKRRKNLTRWGGTYLYIHTYFIYLESYGLCKGLHPLPPPPLWRRTTVASQSRLSMNRFPYKSLKNPKFSWANVCKNRNFAATIKTEIIFADILSIDRY